MNNILIFSLSFIFSLHSAAYEDENMNKTTYVPQSVEHVVATWDMNDIQAPQNRLEEDIIEDVEAYLAKAEEPGKTFLYGMAKTMLEPEMEAPNDVYRMHLLWARVLQHGHQFDKALEHLDVAGKHIPHDTNVNLLKARIYIIQRKYRQAKTACTNMLGYTDAFTVSLCLLEVSSYQGKLFESYQNLQKITVWDGLTESVSIWARLVLSDMATRLGKIDESEAWLDQELHLNHVSYLTAWADTKLKLRKYQEVFDTFTRVSDQLNFPEDAIAIRIAIAEKYLALDNHWQNLVKSRVQLREARQDKAHASDVALYYLEIEPDIERAIYWAKINWQHAKEYQDELLLQRAESLESARRLDHAAKRAEL